MSYVVHMLSYILWLCYHTYNGVVWSIIWVWLQRYSGCAVRCNQCEVRYNSFGVMSRVLWCHKSWVRCHIQCIFSHIYSRCDVISRVCVISLIPCVWSHTHRHEECDVIYSGCIVLTQCVSCQIELICIHRHSGCYVTDIVAVMPQVQWMRCYKLWMWPHIQHIWCHECSVYDVIYSAYDVTYIVGVLS